MYTFFRFGTYTLYNGELKVLTVDKNGNIINKNDNKNEIENSNSMSNKNKLNSKNNKEGSVSGKEGRDYYTKEFEYNNFDHGKLKNKVEKEVEKEQENYDEENNLLTNTNNKNIEDSYEESDDESNGQYLHILKINKKIIDRIYEKKNPRKKCCEKNHDHSHSSTSLSQNTTSSGEGAYVQNQNIIRADDR